ncbi:flagellar biosynthesis regulator FlaF [Ascidiaceihabitans sp.]|uniref:flagellar biosynthesis regulator FlaF n=1 Tax=Ascidiaceihabitans sp. TaxID=1872644 RepID=UPI003297AC17
MNAFSKAKNGYAQHAATTQTDRRAEYDVIVKVTHRLRATAQKAKTDFSKYAEALHDNRRLWNTLAIDVSDADNSLPQELRARVFYLSEFTAQHTTKILREKASVMPLLEINMAVIRGLQNKGASK